MTTPSGSDSITDDTAHDTAAALRRAASPRPNSALSPSVSVAWFLENPGEPSALTDARDRGTTDHATRASAVLQGQKTARAARLLLRLGLLALLCVLLLRWLTR